MAFSIPLGDLVMRLRTDATQFEAMLDKAEAKISAASQRIGALGR